MTGKAAGLHLHIGDGPGELRATRIRHDTERAELVAALLHGEKRRQRPRPRALGQPAKLVLLRKARLNDLPWLRPGPGDEIAEPVIALWTDHQIDDRGAPRHLGALGLGHAARHRDEGALALAVAFRLHLADTAEIGINLFGRLLADVAGVEEH